jgi:hypothetical protein
MVSIRSFSRALNFLDKLKEKKAAPHAAMIATV